MIRQNESHNEVGERGSYVDAPSTAALMPESLIQIMWRGRWTMLLTMILVPVAVFIYVRKATPIYTSTSKIYVEQSGPKIVTEMEEGIMTQSNNYLYTQAELLKSTPILSAALDVRGVRQMMTLAGVDDPMAYLKQAVDARVGKKDDIISVSFDSPHPAEAAFLLNAVVDSYVAYHAARKRNTSAEVLRILQSEKGKHSNALIEKLRAMMNFKKENEALAFEYEGDNIILQRLEKLSAALTEAQLESIDRQSAYESTREMVSDPNKRTQFVDAQLAEGSYVSIGAERAGLTSKLEQLERRRADRLRQVTPGHPGAEALESEIAHLRKQIANLDEEFALSRLATAQRQYLAAKQKEDKIAERLDDQSHQAIDLSEQLAGYAILESDWEQTKKLCDVLDDRIKEVNVTEDTGALNITILEVAQPAKKPSKPRPARYMAVALALGLMLGAGLALLRPLTDQKLRSAEDVCAALGMPVLGMVPSMGRKQSVRVRGQIVHADPSSCVAEAYRTIRTSVFFSKPNGKAKTILVTSPEANEGKTTLVSNLAIAMAQAGQKTLILDADFRNPTQHRIFQMNGSKELVSLLSGTATLEEAIQSTGADHLDLLLCKRQLFNPSEVLNSKSFARLLRDISDKYDRVVIDSAPVMPVTDADILAALCDVTVLVLRSDKSIRKTCQRARDELFSTGACVLGVVVNDVRQKGYKSYRHHHREPAVIIEKLDSYTNGNNQGRNTIESVIGTETNVES